MPTSRKFRKFEPDEILSSSFDQETFDQETLKRKAFLKKVYDRLPHDAISAQIFMEIALLLACDTIVDANHLDEHQPLRDQIDMRSFFASLMDLFTKGVNNVFDEQIHHQCVDLHDRPPTSPS